MSVRVSTLVWERSELQGAPFLLMLALADQANDEGWCWPKQTSLARRLRLETTRAVRKLLEKCVNSGELQVVHKTHEKRYTGNYYRVRLDVLARKESIWRSNVEEDNEEDASPPQIPTSGPNGPHATATSGPNGPHTTGPNGPHTRGPNGPVTRGPNGPNYNRHSNPNNNHQIQPSEEAPDGVAADAASSPANRSGQDRKGKNPTPTTSQVDPEQGNPPAAPKKTTTRATKGKSSAPAALPPLPPELAAMPGFPEVWELWIKHREEKRKPLTPTSVQLQHKELLKHPDPIDLIEYTISRGWDGLRDRDPRDARPASATATTGAATPGKAKASARDFEAEAEREFDAALARVIAGKPSTDPDTLTRKIMNLVLMGNSLGTIDNRQMPFTRKEFVKRYSQERAEQQV